MFQSFTEFYLVLPIFCNHNVLFGVYMVFPTTIFVQFYLVLPSFTEFYRVLPSFTEFSAVNWRLLSCYWVLLGLPYFKGLYYYKFYPVHQVFTGYLAGLLLVLSIRDYILLLQFLMQ